MKTRILSVVLLTFLSLYTSAQGNQSNIFGVRAGINFQNITGKNFDGSKADNDLKTGFNVGVTAQLPIAPDFYFQTGLLFTTKGMSHNSTILGQTIKSKVTLGYLELPLHLMYKPALGSGHLLLGFGPYVGYGITGKGHYETSGIVNASDDFDVKYDSEVSESDFSGGAVYKPFDVGADIFFGYEFGNRISAQVNTQLGLVKINPTYKGVSDDKTSYKHTGFGVSVGYLF